ncbi:uncharacterized protein LOC111875313 [Cryptotermes secundus]|uniref:uncharacterized protein LOC111875313 n=1 Tax=Cryptotermes secundus TaxID=105785 RepID=UPI001454D521|nr:uncharacterized protein LOC111875313 [Cryptotermes secundus]
MEGEHDKEEFGNMCFHSPHKDSRDPHSRTDRITDSVSPTHMSSPSADLPLYETSKNGTSLAPSFSSENIRLGKEDERQVAFPAATDLSHSTSDRIRNIALRKLQLNGRNGG